VIGVSNPDLTLFPGMTANVKILVDRVPCAEIPNAALRYRPPTRTAREAAPGPQERRRRKGRLGSRSQRHSTARRDQYRRNRRRIHGSDAGADTTATA
jgi:hypothetical protein